MFVTSPGVRVKISSVVVGGLKVELEASASIDVVLMNSIDGSVVVSGSSLADVACDGVASDELKVDLSSSAVVEVFVSVSDEDFVEDSDGVFPADSVEVK